MNQPLRRLLALLPLFLLCVALAACGGDDKAGSGGESTEADHDQHGHEHATPNGGVIVESSDHSMHFEIVHDAGAGLVKLWLYDGDVKPVSTSEIPVINLPLDAGPVQVKGVDPKGGASATEWHFSHEALKGHVHGARLRVMAMDRSYMVDLPDAHDDHEGHEHDGDEHGHDDHEGHAHEGHAHDDGDHDHTHEGPHHGLVQPFASEDGKTAGYVELKLHDDKGDLELWIAKDEAIKTPFDLPSATAITVTFRSMKDRQVTLRVRNTDKNEDEDGVANLRDGMTNYFIFPGDTGADASWLQGKTFKATVSISFEGPQGTYTTSPFELKPHTH